MSNRRGEKTERGAPSLKRFFLVTGLVLLLFFVDQLTKYFVCKFLKPYQTIKIIKGFYFTLVFNKGIAFGLFSKWGGIFLFINLILLIYLTIFLRKYLTGEARFNKALPFIFILGGALGNIADRLRLGLIVDFIDFKIWPVFNLADTFITLGIIWLLKDAIWHKKI